MLSLFLIFNTANLNILWNFTYLDKNWNIYKCRTSTVQKRPQLLFHIFEEPTAWMSGWKVAMWRMRLCRKPLLLQEDMKMVYKVANTQFSEIQSVPTPKYLHEITGLQICKSHWHYFAKGTKFWHFVVLKDCCNLFKKILCLLDGFWWRCCSRVFFVTLTFKISLLCRNTFIPQNIVENVVMHAIT